MPSDRAADGATACRNIAVLFDADNAEPALAGAVLDQVARFGAAVVRRAYGDWTQLNMASWRPVMLAKAIHPMQQFRHAAGKNATDCAMIIDAMDLLHSRRFHGFALVSSDSDFAGLARRMREDALIVLGFGRRNTVDGFVAACDHFVFTEDLAQPRALPLPSPPAAERSYDELLKLVGSAIGKCRDDTGWAHLGPVGTTLAAMLPGFDPRHWGARTRKLTALIAGMPEIEMRWHNNGALASPTPYARLRVRTRQEDVAPSTPTTAR